MKKLREITIVLLMVLSLFSALVIVNTPYVKAEQNGPIQNPGGYYETPNADWIIDPGDNKLYENMKIVVNKNLTIKNGGKLTLSNVTLQMNQTMNDRGETIHVEGGGELNVINGSIITTDPITPAQSPDPYEFKIDGVALINNSIVEKMADLSGEADGIQIWSSSVTITNSTIRQSSGNGLYLNNTQPTIGYCNISNNTYHGVFMDSVNNCTFENNIVNSNGLCGIALWESSYNNITSNNVSSNNKYGIKIYQYSNNNNIIGNKVFSNYEYGIKLKFANCTNIKANTVCSQKRYDGIFLEYSHENNIIDNNVSSNYRRGIHACTKCDANNISSNNVFDNDLGIELCFGSSKNNVTGNNVSNNYYHGIYLQAVHNNNIIGNNVSNTVYWYGIGLGSSTENNILNNNVSNNNYGIYITTSKNNSIENNIVSSNNIDGIRLSDHGLGPSLNNDIIGNNASSNGWDGIHLYSSSNNKIINNNLM